MSPFVRLGRGEVDGQTGGARLKIDHVGAPGCGTVVGGLGDRRWLVARSGCRVGFPPPEDAAEAMTMTAAWSALAG